MVKNDLQTRKLSAFLKRVKGPKELPESQDVLTLLVTSFLQWNATVSQAQRAYSRLMQIMVDFNDLRVSSVEEVIEAIGVNYPRAEERAARLHEVLREVYLREHEVSLASLSDKPKKHVRAYLESLPGMPLYVATRVMLMGFDVHAMPVDERLVRLLEEEGLVSGGASAADVANLIERQVRAEDAARVHHGLQKWADQRGGRVADRKPASTPKRARRGSSSKKSTKKRKSTSKR